MIAIKKTISESILWSAGKAIINSPIFIFISCALSTILALFFLLVLDVLVVSVAVSTLKKDSGVLGVYAFNVIASFVIAGLLTSVFVEIRSWVRRNGFLSRSRVVFYVVYIFFCFVIFVGESFDDPAFSSGAGMIFEIEMMFHDLDWSEHAGLLSLVQNYFLIFMLLILFFWMVRLEKPINAFLVKFLVLVWVYLFSGILFSAAWVVLYLSNNSALTAAFEAPFDAVYFSFITMTTLGYGDISPVSSNAKFIAVAQSVFGVFFSSLLVGMAVGYTLTVFDARKK